MKVSSTVLKTSGYREVLAEFNLYLPTVSKLDSCRLKLGTGRNQTFVVG